jgi:L-aminopeptidase/D-esterase-like protein
MYNSIIDVKGIQVGHAQNREAGTGCTVIIIEKGAVAGVDVRGAAPGTRETDLLDPSNTVQKVHAIYLSGGSAYGLDGAAGVMEYLEMKGIGFQAGSVKVPIVPGAVIFDLDIGDSSVRPDKVMGYQACVNASNKQAVEGCVGAGTGATVGKYFGISRCMKGGLGTASIKINELVVGALVVVNAFGDIVNPTNGKVLAGALDEEKKQFASRNQLLYNQASAENSPFLRNTTLGVVATNAKMSKAEAKRLSMSAHDGFAKSIFPSHTLYDGDVIFSLATGEINTDLNRINMLSAYVISLAIQRAILEASMMFGIPSHNDIIKNK